MSENTVGSTPTREFLPLSLKMIVLVIFTLLICVLENYLGLLLIVSAAPYVVFQDYLIYFGLGLSSARYVVKIGTNTIMYDYYQEDSASVPMIYVCFFLGVEKRDCIYGEFRQDPGSNTTNDATQTSTTKEQLQTNTVKGNFASEPDLSMNTNATATSATTPTATEKPIECVSQSVMGLEMVPTAPELKNDVIDREENVPVLEYEEQNVVSSARQSEHTLLGQESQELQEPVVMKWPPSFLVNVLNPEDDIPMEARAGMHTHPFDRNCYYNTALEIVGLVGRGGFGHVCLARIENDGGHVAVKSVPKPADLKELEMVVKELEVLEMVRNSQMLFLMQDEAIFQTLTAVNIVLPFCPASFTDMICQSGRFPAKAIKFAICEMLIAMEGLQTLGIFHRDIKPCNILVDEDGHVVFGDYGLAMTNVNIKTRIKGVTAGTEGYMAPEVKSGKTSGLYSDYYSLGAAIFNMVYGFKYRPYPEKNSRIAPNVVFPSRPVDAKLKSLLSGLLQVYPSKRLGYKGINQVLKHSYFDDVDWNSVRKKELVVPQFFKNVIQEAKYTHELPNQFIEYPELMQDGNYPYQFSKMLYGYPKQDL